MKSFCIKNGIFFILFIWCFSCSTNLNEPIEFAVSEGVMNNLNFDPIGMQSGQKMPKILVYKLNGQRRPLFQSNSGRPMLVVTGSYTCDVTRAQLPGLQRIKDAYQNRMDIVLVNTLEAHPQSSQSPYSAEPAPWPSIDNINQGISAEQPLTMQGRRDLAEQWVKEQQIEVPVVLDGPKNEFWKQAGQAPNMAVLINAEGEIISKQAWFSEEKLIEAIETEL